MFETDYASMERQPLLSLKTLSNGRPLLASFLASLMSFAAGTVVAGWTPSQLPTTPMTIGEKLFVMKTEDETSWIVSIYVFGALVGAIPAGQISQTIGRKKTLLLLAVPMTVGWIIIMFFVDNVYLVYIGRILCGLSVGAVTVAVPLYNSDIATDVCRGRGGVFLDFMLCGGILYSYIASSFLGLQTFSLTCSLIPVVFCILFSFMPESPQYLYSKRRYVESKSVLLWLRGPDFDVNDEFDNYAKLQNEDDETPATLIKKKSFEKSSTFVKAFIFSMALATIQRMSGAGAIIQYTTKLFDISGSSVQPITASIITGVFQLIGSGVTIALIDKVGRRKLLLISSAVVVACLSMLTIYFYYLNKCMLENSFRILPIFIVCTYIAFFRLGLGPIPWFMSNELLGSDHNNRAESYVASYSWLLSFFVMKTFITLVNDWPVAIWFGYSIISFIGFIFILFFIPETNNKNSDEVRSLLMKTCQIKCQNDEVED